MNATKNRIGWWLTLGAAVITSVLWGPVLVGQRVLVAGDILYGVLPWAGSVSAHTPANRLVSDVVVTTLAWQTVLHNAFWQGHLPLWNPYALSGSPLLANDQTGAFFPLTLATLPFSPAHAISLVMIAKLWIAGLGTAFFLRQLGAGAKAAAFGAVAFASSSYIVIWLGYPNGMVAALLPLGFASVEWYLRAGRPQALALLALDIGLMFLVGHAPSEAHLLGALGAYAAVRISARRLHRWRGLAGLMAAGLSGLLLGAVQVLPFIEALRLGVTFNLRQGQHAGEGHLGITNLATWITPNSHGNPAIDGLVGRLPNFSESTGFAGVAALVLSGFGGWYLWRRQRSAAVALVGLLLVCVGIVYGPLSPIAGRLPILAVSNNARLISVICLCVAVLGGLGVEFVLSGPRRASRAGIALALTGGAGLLALTGAWILWFRLRGGVDSLVPPIHSNIGFWVIVGAVSFVAALSLVIAGRWGGVPDVATAGIMVLALAEAMLFAFPFNPLTPPAEVPPPSEAMDWLRSHAGSGSVAASYPAMIPESATLYGLHDVGGYDLVVTPRVVAYWTAADPGFQFRDNHTNLSRPAAKWLAAAGVTEILAPGDEAIPGTVKTFAGEGVTIGAVPAARPFAYAAEKPVVVPDPAAAAAAMRPDPLAVVAVERCCAADGEAVVRVLSRADDTVKLHVDARAPATVVVGQAYYPGWEARVDGRPVEIQAANILFQSVQVPAGSHEVVLRYQPASFGLGAALSLLGAIGVLGLAFLERVRRAIRGRPPAALA